MAKKNIDSPAIIIVGETVGQLTSPQKILYTGLTPDYAKYNEKIIHYPLIKVIGIELPEMDLQEYDAIMFTSKSAVNSFFSQSIPPFLKGVRGISSPPFLKGVRGIFSIGHETAKEINKFGYRVDYISEKPDSDSLAELVKQKNYKKILYPCSDISDNALHKLNNVHPKIIYKIEFVDQPKIDLSDFKGIVFSSPSTVKSFLKIYENIPENLVCYVLGKHTEKALLNAGDARIIKKIKI
jgi:uroporphyrinogen-III synthase